MLDVFNYLGWTELCFSRIMLHVYAFACWEGISLQSLAISLTHIFIVYISYLVSLNSLAIVKYIVSNTVAHMQVHALICLESLPLVQLLIVLPSNLFLK